MSDNGLTLLEALVGIAIMAALATLALPMLQPKPDANLNLAVREVVAQLRAAHTGALRSGTTTEVAVDAAAGRIGDDRLARTDPPLRLAFGDGSLAREGGVADVLRFHPDGSASGGRLVLSQGARSVAVVVDWLTGRVEAREVQR